MTRAIEILLVEDNAGDVRLMREALKNDGRISNKLHTVTDGEKAIEYLRQKGEYADVGRPDLILLDLNLPKKDGREVLAEIKSDPNLHQIPVIVLTTSQAEEDILKSYDFNANCYISKPVDIDEFLSITRTLKQFWISIVKLPSRE